MHVILFTGTAYEPFDTKESGISGGCCFLALLPNPFFGFSGDLRFRPMTYFYIKNDNSSTSFVHA